MKKTPFMKWALEEVWESKKCRRCSAEFHSPYPPIVHPERNAEIASKDWCASCNARSMTIIKRDNCAYEPLAKELK